MAHFAEIDENNLVIRVVTTDNEDPNGDEGLQWLVDTLGGTWIQTSYNARVRNKFAGIGDVYDAQRDAFIPAKPREDAIFDEDSLTWLPDPDAPTTVSG